MYSEILLCLAVIVSFVVGYSVALRKLNRRSYGSLHIETSDPDGPYLFLELKPDALPKLGTSEYIMLKVDTRNYISRK